MTLILALASRHRVLQVSDRQLTNIHPITKERSAAPHPATKSVVFEDRAIFGYTGLSILERLKADVWIAGIISQVEDGDVMRAIELIRVGLQRAFHPLKVPDPVPYQAVLVSGFRIIDKDSFKAFNALIANAQNNHSPSRSFAVEMFDVPFGQMALTQAPVWIKPKDFAALNRTIERSGARGATFASGTDILARAIRDVAAQHAEVGSDLITASVPVPRNMKLGGAYVGRGRPADAGGTFEYLSLAQDATHYAPTMVLGGITYRDVVEHHS